MRSLYHFDRSDSALIVGLGKSGIATVEVLSARGVVLRVTDDAPRAALAAPIATCERLGAPFIDPLEIASMAPVPRYSVLSPGVPLTSPIVQALHEAAIPVLGEIEVAYRLCAAPIIAITGTKGKSTTSALITHLLRHAGRTVRLGGNIGDPLIREVVGAQPQDWVVAEVSSFQLETTSAFKPRVAVLLNIAPDHLDRYDSMADYARAKYRIFENQSANDIFIGDFDDVSLAALRGGGSAPAIPSRAIWFTVGARRDGVSLFVDGASIMYAPQASATPVEIAYCSDIALVGEHNLRNVMAAALAALAAEVDPRVLRDGIRSFQAMAHRLEPIADVDGVRYVDDSKATNPSAVVAALRAYDRSIVLIAGGRAKGSGFTAMSDEIRARVKALVLIGEAADEIASHVRGVPTVRAASMEEAVQRARDVSQSGDVVLLSPGCASFDMFRSAEDRGERFADAVKRMQRVTRV